MTDIRLSRFRLSDCWHPLFARLDSWRQDPAGNWTNGISFVETAYQQLNTAQFGFEVLGLSRWRAICEIAGVGNGGDVAEEPLEFTIKAPSGIPVSFSRVSDSFVGVGPQPVVLLNHVAVNAVDFMSEWRWFESILGPTTVLQRDSVWEPTSQKFVRDAHLYKSPSFYVTLRESDSISTIDHIGWMVDNRATVDRMAQLLKALSWSISFGPEDIDGSYLLHFMGPDGGIHDFFFPTEYLQSRFVTLK